MDEYLRQIFTPDFVRSLITFILGALSAVAGGWLQDTRKRRWEREDRIETYNREALLDRLDKGESYISLTTNEIEKKYDVMLEVINENFTGELSSDALTKFDSLFQYRLDYLKDQIYYSASLRSVEDKRIDEAWSNWLVSTQNFTDMAVEVSQQAFIDKIISEPSEIKKQRAKLEGLLLNIHETTRILLKNISTLRSKSV